MKLLIFVQAVDKDDQLMGFFHRWLELASAHVTTITVCALRVGRYELPANVRVISLDPEKQKKRLSIIGNLWRYSWKLRQEYDAVFVRGDAIYLVLAGWLWRLLGKRVAFWYAHYGVFSPFFWIGSIFAQIIVTSVPEANPLHRAHAIGQQIDTTFFVPSTDENRYKEPLQVLHVGRVSPVKRVSWMIEALHPFLEHGSVQLRLIGKPSDPQEEARVTTASQGLSGIEWQKQGTTFEETAEAYRAADLFVSATPGSLDKTLLEAAAGGCIVFATTPGFQHGLPEELRWLYVQTPMQLREGIKRVQTLSLVERQKIGVSLRSWVETYHAIEGNIAAVISLLEGRKNV